MRCRCCGSTQKSVVFDVLNFAEELRAGEMAPGYMLSAELSYLSVNGLVTAW